MQRLSLKIASKDVLRSIGTMPVILPLAKSFKILSFKQKRRKFVEYFLFEHQTDKYIISSPGLEKYLFDHEQPFLKLWT